MKLAYRLYQLLVAAPLLLCATALTALVTIVGCAFDARFWGYYPAVVWSRLMCRLMLLPVRVEGRECLREGQSYVFVANHQGAYDIFLIYGYLGRHFKWMMKKSLGSIPLVGRACRSAGHIMVDKSGPKAVRQTYEDARRVLRGGTSLFVFPEGARTFTGRAGAFRRGAFQLADELRLPVVPVTIDGPFDVLPRQRGLGFLTRHTLRLVIHRPIPPSGQGADDISATMRASRRAIVEALPARHRDPDDATR